MHGNDAVDALQDELIKVIFKADKLTNLWHEAQEEVQYVKKEKEMAIKALTIEHNETDFKRIKEIADMEWSLKDARAEIKAITEKAGRELERYTNNTMGYE